MVSSTSSTEPKPISKVSHPSRLGLFYAILDKTVHKIDILKIITASIAAIVAANVIASAPITEVPELSVADKLEAVSDVETVSRWILPGASENEERVLAALQERGITDRAALATVMGNIKQESRFHSNICEGGARTHYWGCTRGGYGLIQWTTLDRYNGLGSHALTVGYDPSTVDAQVSYLFTERQWQGIEGSLKHPGQSINFYMQKAYRWLGWGHHGRRTDYAWEYYYDLQETQVLAK